MKRKSLTIILFMLIFAVNAVSQEIDSVSIAPLNPKVGTYTLYQVSFVYQDSISANDRFSLVFPEAFDLSRVTLAGSKSMNGGFTVSVRDSVLEIRRNGEGRIISPGEQVDLLFSVVKNPLNAANNYIIQFRVLDNLGNALSSKQVNPIEIVN